MPLQLAAQLNSKAKHGRAADRRTHRRWEDCVEVAVGSTEEEVSRLGALPHTASRISHK